MFVSGIKLKCDFSYNVVGISGRVPRQPPQATRLIKPAICLGPRLKHRHSARNNGFYDLKYLGSNFTFLRLQQQTNLIFTLSKRLEQFSDSHVL